MNAFASLKVTMYILFYACLVKIIALKRLKKDEKTLECYDQFISEGNVKTSCCKIGDGMVKCKPYFIIAGTQKSGTTALSAFLSDHPDVNFHPKKEAHFFDRDKSYNKGMLYYLNQFNNISTTIIPKSSSSSVLSSSSSSSSSAQKYIYGESTPFYLASRNACKRINQMLPEVKLIILLREPVSRAYSEYQMKVRRVNQQNGFIQLMQTYSIEILTCMKFYSKRYELEFLKNCLPLVITQHAHWNKFVSANYKGNFNDDNDSFKVITTSNKKLKRGSVKHSSFSSSSSSHSSGSSSYDDGRFNIASKCYSTSPEFINMNTLSSSSSSSSLLNKAESISSDLVGTATATAAAIATATAATTSVDQSSSHHLKASKRSSYTFTHHLNKSITSSGTPSDNSNSNVFTSVTGIYMNTSTLSTTRQLQQQRQYSSGYADYRSIGRVRMSAFNTSSFSSSSSFDDDDIILPSDQGIISKTNSSRRTATNMILSSDKDSPPLHPPHHHHHHHEGDYYYFQPISCLGKSAKEYLLSPREALIGEIKEFNSCADATAAATSQQLKHRQQQQQQQYESADVASVDSSLRELDMVVEKCVKVKSGITRQYMYRSLYIAQLYHCLKSMNISNSRNNSSSSYSSSIDNSSISNNNNRNSDSSSKSNNSNSHNYSSNSNSHNSSNSGNNNSSIDSRSSSSSSSGSYSSSSGSSSSRREEGRILILPSERLQQQPQATINHILRFLHLTSNDNSHHNNNNSSSSSSSATERVPLPESEYLSTQRAVAKYFPNFEANTGWRLHSSYEPLDEAIAAAMREFLAPYNQLLFDYLNIEPYPEWTS